jgi:pimeloyl-ACP methyl ester carboxylesterase
VIGSRAGWGLAGAVAGLATGVVTEHVALHRRRTADPEGTEDFGSRRGSRTRILPRADGAWIFVEEAGPPADTGVLFIHGSSLRSDTWHYQMAGMPGRRLVFYDLRGHGRSARGGRAPYSVATLVEDLRAVLEDAGLREVCLVGHSLGGMVALELCCRYPELMGSAIKSLVLCNTTYRPAIETVVGGAAVARLERITRRPFDFVGSQHQRVDSLRKLVRPSDALFWTVSFAGFGPGASAKQIDFTYDMLADTPSATIFDLFRAYRDFDVTDHLADINVPALVIGGTHDRVTVPEASEYLAARMPKAELVILEGCGHMAMMERHADFNERLERFLTDTLAPRIDERWERQ